MEGDLVVAGGEEDGAEHGVGGEDFGFLTVYGGAPAGVGGVAEDEEGGGGGLGADEDALWFIMGNGDFADNVFRCGGGGREAGGRRAHQDSLARGSEAGGLHGGDGGGEVGLPLPVGDEKGAGQDVAFLVDFDVAGVDEAEGGGHQAVKGLVLGIDQGEGGDGPGSSGGSGGGGSGGGGEGNGGNLGGGIPGDAPEVAVYGLRRGR